jgi:hypothetical protein
MKKNLVYSDMTQLVSAAVDYRASDVLTAFQHRTRLKTHRKTLIVAARRIAARIHDTKRPTYEQILDLLVDCGFERSEFPTEPPK